jgi:hypothetical protein
MRVALTLLLAVHAALHLIGFAELYESALPELGGETLVSVSGGSTRAVGVLWLVAAAVLLGAAVLRTLRSEVWSVVAGAGAALSQGLIVLNWADAKAGTAANVVIAVAVAVTVATSRFKGKVSDEVRGLLARADRRSSSAVRSFELERLPQPVRRWLIRSGVVGKPRTTTVRLKQRGEIRTSPTGAWMPARAEQYFSVDPPAFVWSVDVTMRRVLPVIGRDRYGDGKGSMLIKAMSLLNVVDASGEAIDQGSLLRYLAEIVWFPSAALSPHITWVPLDGSRAKAIMSYGGVTVSAVFSFDAQGRFSSLRALRPMGSGRSAKLEEWFVPVFEWRRVDGVEVPVRGDVVWRLSTGDFDCYRWEITDIEFDPTSPYPAEVERAGEKPVKAARSHVRDALAGEVETNPR